MEADTSDGQSQILTLLGDSGEDVHPITLLGADPDKKRQSILRSQKASLLNHQVAQLVAARLPPGDVVRLSEVCSFLRGMEAMPLDLSMQGKLAAHSAQMEDTA